MNVCYFNGHGHYGDEEELWGKEEDKGRELDSNVAVAPPPGGPIKAIKDLRLCGLRTSSLPFTGSSM
jgi:hypothetical protein